MRDVPEAFAAHLGGGATTLCRCWRLIRRDGTVLGFTDHDRDLAFDGTAFAARSGLEAAEATSELGFAVGGGDVSGALTSDGITEAEIAAGLYDDASVETWLVNWGAPEDERFLLDRSSIGEVRRVDGALVAELRGPMHRLGEEGGLVFRRSCSADLGDARCGIDLGSSAYAGLGTVSRSDGALGLAAGGLEAFPPGWFTAGRLSWTTGANAGAAVEVKVHRLIAEVAQLDLWQRMAAPIEIGDSFRVTAGCDKSLSTCAAKFDNVLNHRGFPHMPGNDFVLKVAAQGEAGLDGGSLFR